MDGGDMMEVEVYKKRDNIGKKGARGEKKERKEKKEH